MSKKKNFISGSAKDFSFGINLDLNLTKLLEGGVTRHQAKSGDEFVKLTLARRDEKDQFGNDYMIYENDFVPDSTRAKRDAISKKIKNSSDEEGDELPF